MEKVPSQKYCPNCKKPVSGKRTFCDDKCRISYSRKLKKGEQPEQSESEQIPTRTGLTRTDSLFENKTSGYYNFTDNRYGRTCLMCEKKFTTSLKLLKVCSPKCQSNLLKGLSGRLSQVKEDL